MEEKTFNFWQNHSAEYLQMAFRHDQRERPAHSDGYGKRTGRCGDTVEIFLSIRDGQIQSVSFDADGCLNTNACCNTVAYLAKGRRVQAAWEIQPDDVIAFLKTLQPENYHCAELACGALYLALANYQETQRDPWKKLYQTR
jgi:nitrogen fixation NifU-like protein